MSCETCGAFSLLCCCSFPVRFSAKFTPSSQTPTQQDASDFAKWHHGPRYEKDKHLPENEANIEEVILITDELVVGLSGLASGVVILTGWRFPLERFQGFLTPSMRTNLSYYEKG